MARHSNNSNPYAEEKKAGAVMAIIIAIFLVGVALVVGGLMS